MTPDRVFTLPQASVEDTHHRHYLYASPRGAGR